MLAYLIGILAFFQVQNFDIDYYNTQKGLSNNIVYDVHQDQQGFIWIATENGLNQFDGYEFKTFYYSEGNPRTISSNIVRSMYESKDGKLWIGTRRAINMFDKKTETFTRFPIHDSLRIPFEVAILRADTEERLWSVLGSKLVFFDTKKQVYDKVELSFFPYRYVVDANDVIWISGDDGEFYTYDIRTKDLIQIGQNSTDINLSFFLSGDKKSIFYNSIGKKIDIENWEEIFLPNKDAKAYRFYEDSKGRRWFGSKEQLYMQKKAGEPLIEIDLSENPEPILSNIKAITEDRSGGIWVGTVDGLYRIKNKEKNFQQLIRDTGRQTAMAIEEINNTWWVNYFSKGLSKYQFNNSGALISSSAINLKGGVNQIWDIQPVGDDKIWLATEHGLFEMDTSTSEISKMEVFKEEKEDEVFFIISEADNNTYWAGGYSVLLKLSAKTGEVLEQFGIFDGYKGLLIQDIISVDGGLLVAAEKYGLFFYSAEQGLRKKWKTNDIPQQLDQTSIWDMYQAKDKTLWFGGNSGLYSISSQKEFLNPLKANIGKNMIVFSITEDRNQLLWLGTDKGLVSYNPNTEEFRVFDSDDGFENPEFNRRSIFTSKNGKVVAGGMSGVIYFDPEEININQNEPEVWVTGFSIITPDSAKKLTVHEIEEVNLNWQQNTFEINFTALNYTNPSQNQYKYKLENYDPDWVSPENSRLARYVRVPAGEYTFKVIASNNDGIWNETGDSIKITISPPFWQTIWFRLMVIVCVFAIVWMLYRFRVRQLLEVERVRLRIAGDLHDEIGSGLSGIALTGDLLQNQAKEGTPKPEMIQKISGNARSLASSLDSIVWLIDPNKESLLDLLIKCKRAARDLLPNLELVIKDEIPESLHKKELSSEIRRGFYLIFKEAVHNIYKHAKAEEVRIGFYIESGKLTICVKDDGIGFDEEKVLKGKGIENLRKRAKEMKATLKLDAREANGTSVIIQKALP